MSRLQVPLLPRTLYASGDVLLRAEIALLIKDRSGAWHKEIVRLDSGSEMTTMLAAHARKLDLPIPRQAVLGLTMRGQAVRSGFLRARVIGMDATEYVFPCYFLGDPVAPVQTSFSAAWPPGLLGLTGVVNQLRISFDGDPGPAAPHGHLIVEKK